VVIDGGKGQLGMALAAARDVGIDVRPGPGLMLVGLAKERDLDGETPVDAAEAPAVPAAEPAPVAGEPVVPGGHSAEPAAPVSVHADGAAQGGLAGLAGLAESSPHPSELAPPPDELDSPSPSPPPAAIPTPESSKRRTRGAAGDAQRGGKDGRRPDRIYLPHAKDAIPIRPSSAEMFVLQHLRDEAHRFAISFHRRRRGSLTLRSALADVPGIGPQRQRLLLRHFGSLKKIREVMADELASVPGMNAKTAAAVAAHLGAPGAPAPRATGNEGLTAPLPAEPRAEGLPLLAGPGGPAGSPDDAEQDAVESAFGDVEDEPADELTDKSM
jgi:hypothetical protein